jgi:hypothetical protein
MSNFGRFDYFKGGDWNAYCDICGFKWKASYLKKRWDGFMCCPKDYEPRQSQDFVRGVPDNMSVPWSRPDQGDTFITKDDVDPANFQSSLT